MEFKIDRDLPISIRQQLKGLIEYGIACGDLAVGEALPSVRDLAARVGVAPMTVSQVYGDLKGLGLIETRAGAGTSVAGSSQAGLVGRPDLMTLHRRIDALIDEGMALGLRASDLASLIHARLASRARLGRSASVVMVGLFAGPTARYAHVIAARLGQGATVEPMTIDAIQRDPAVQARAASADLVVTFVNRHREVASILPGARVVSIRFIPSEETRRALASIDPMARVLLVARFPEFLPIMKAGVLRFAPHVSNLRSAGASSDDALLARDDADVIVFASGTDSVLSGLKASVRAIEYIHIPEPGDIDRLIVPLIQDTASKAAKQS
ncbi:DNA-binding transcriptional regulator YhcF (GntR family) [Bosea sp. BE125]|uniref:GntR family transcriptional regulator n=1 Tax=Bosea sp. BE125 TaxID=2817909 RepID=UPI00286359D8|nr:GntR family transcriptional regulator [Bosea sp. BE125]MDR6874897.1 DNA-binding transcriptional regulator YhcF (GntR family) [Bosea sp. BE125]